MSCIALLLVERIATLVELVDLSLTLFLLVRISAEAICNIEVSNATVMLWLPQKFTLNGTL